MQNNKNSQAKIKANARYTAKTYLQLKINIKPDTKQLIDDFCKKKEISKAQFIVSACKYFIERDLLPPEVGTDTDTQGDTDTE